MLWRKTKFKGVQRDSRGVAILYCTWRRQPFWEGDNSPDAERKTRESHGKLGMRHFQERGTGNSKAKCRVFLLRLKKSRRPARLEWSGWRGGRWDPTGTRGQVLLSFVDHRKGFGFSCALDFPWLPIWLRGEQMGLLFDKDHSSWTFLDQRVNERVPRNVGREIFFT